jgi:galactokinase
MPEPLRIRAPGRVNLIGEHTDHTGGLVLPVAIDRAIELTVDFGGREIRLRSADAEGQVAVAADGSETPHGGWGRFVAAVAHELAAIGRAPIGMRGEVSSDLPLGAGLSSSAALEVVVALGLLAAAEMDLEPLRIAALCRRAEQRAVGVTSGIMDQAAALLGRSGHAVLLDCGTLRHRWVPFPDDLGVVVLDSGIHRDLESSGYATRTRELAAALPVLGGRRPADVDPADLDELLTRLDPLPARRLRHVITENQRVRAAERALRDGRLTELGRLFDESHASLRDDFEVSTPELDSLTELARAEGADAARMTGGGFGGSVVALVRADRTSELAERVLEGYRRRHPRRRGRSFVVETADGAGRLPRHADARSSGG